jgi:hypothetical protein
MAISFAFYADSGLTTPVSSEQLVQAADGSLSPAQVEVFFGSTVAGRQARAASNPGTDQIILSVNDSNPGGGEPASAIKLALTQGGLAGATGGAPLNLGTQILSGSGNAVPVWIQFTDSTAVVQSDSTISLQLNSVVEDAYP